MKTVKSWVMGISLLALAGCGDGGAGSSVTTAAPQVLAPKPVLSVNSSVIATFAAPWSMAFLPDGQLLVTERPPVPTTLNNPTEPGRLRLVDLTGTVSAPLAGLPANVGLLDVKLDPQYATTHRIYISYMERDPSAPRVGRDAADTTIDPAGLAVMQGALIIDATGPHVTGATTIWRQMPKIVSYPGSGEPGGRMAFSPDQRYLYVAAGDRQELDATELFSTANTLGKIIRLYPDGSVPQDNPFVGKAGTLPEIWTLGHRNQYGLNFNSVGQLWEHEMGPKGGDEFNLIQPGNNYGWPAVSYGNNYDDSPIPKPAAGDGFTMAAYWWTPVIAPSDMIFYSGTLFGDWRGDAIITGLQSQGLVRVRVSGTSASEVQRISLGTRMRSISQAPDGSIWVLEDQPTGRLLRLTPVF